MEWEERHAHRCRLLPLANSSGFCTAMKRASTATAGVAGGRDARGDSSSKKGDKPTPRTEQPWRLSGSMSPPPSTQPEQQPNSSQQVERQLTCAAVTKRDVPCAESVLSESVVSDELPGHGHSKPTHSSVAGAQPSQYSTTSQDYGRGVRVPSLGLRSSATSSQPYHKVS